MPDKKETSNEVLRRLLKDHSLHHGYFSKTVVNPPVTQQTLSRWIHGQQSPSGKHGMSRRIELSLWSQKHYGHDYHIKINDWI